ncbi:MAG: UTP--glucose-1-phosphate uridylyltransferase GalU [Terriglobales bacterium]|jgi:UTP--glucose-1-phosphate uridylyltransferase
MMPDQDRRVLADRRHVHAVRKAVFPAAGLGTRFLPATKAQPKEMLPLVDKPIIQYGVEEAVAAGCDQIILVTGRGKSAIEDHFDVSYELETMLEQKGKLDLLKIVRQISDMIYVSYVRQKEALGLGHAVLTARELVGNEPFAVLLADDVIDAKVPVLKQLMEVFNERQCSVIATMAIDGPAISSYGVIKGKEVEGSGGRLFEILDLVEKPKVEDAPSNLAVIGRYILTPAIFEMLSNVKPGAGGELQLTDGLRALLKREKIYAYVYEGRRHDTGDKLGFLKATVEFALKREDLGGAFREYLKGLKLYSTISRQLPIMTDHEQARIREIITTIKPLAAEYYRLTKKPLGITGEVAEHVAETILGVSLVDARNAGYDALRGKERIQIKGRAYGVDAKPGQRMSTIKLQADCDTVLLVLLDPTTFEPREMWEAPYSECCHYLRATEAKGRKRGAMPVSAFKHLPSVKRVFPA